MLGSSIERLVYVTLVLGSVALVVLAVISGTGRCATRGLGLNTPGVEGTLSPADCRVREMIGGNDNSPAHQYQITLPEAGRLSVLLTSTQFDAFVIVYDPQRSRVVCTNDDGGGNRNALCVVPDLAAGSYVVVVKALGGNTGGYRVQAGFTRQTATSGCRLNEMVLNGPEVFGTLSDASCRVQAILGRGTDSSPADQYRITVPQRGTLQIDLRSDAFDAYLTLLDSSSQEIAHDDDGGGNRDARVALTLDPGTYIIVAKSLNQRTGAYRMQASFKT